MGAIALASGAYNNDYVKLASKCLTPHAGVLIKHVSRSYAHNGFPLLRL